MIPVMNATRAHAQELNDELQSHKALAPSTLLAQSTLLVVFLAFCLCCCCSRTVCWSYKQQFCSLTYSQHSPHRTRHPSPL